MCRNTKTTACLCHLIQPLLIADKGKIVRSTYFTPNAIEESYDFLQEAYALITLKVKVSDVEITLQKLVDDYLNDDSEHSINVDNDQHKLSFLAAYDQFCGKKIRKLELYQKLESLINDVHKLVYNNLSDNENFTTLLVSLNSKSDRRHSLTLLAPPKDTPPSRGSKNPDTPRPKVEESKDDSVCSIM